MSRLSDSSNSGQGQASSTAGQLRDKAAETAQNVREMGGQLRDAAKSQYDNLRNQAGDYYEQGRAKAQEWEHSVESYVQEKPIQSLLIAAGVGMLLGMLWRRS